MTYGMAQKAQNLDVAKVKKITTYGTGLNKVVRAELLNGVKVRAEIPFKVRAGRKPRVYAGTLDDADVEKLVGFPHSDLEYTLKGDDPDMDKLWKRWNRAEMKLMRKKANKTLEAMGLKDLDSKQLRFSRKAGCSMCPCSPGFILDAHFELKVNKERFIVTEFFSS